MSRAGPIGLMLAITAPAAAQGPSPAQVQGAMQRVGQVIASQCQAGGDRSGSAFVWPDAQHVVTARHVVAGCGRVRVQFPGGPSLEAVPERERAREDLLLLRLQGSSNRQPVKVAAALPPIHSRVAAVGYALGAPTPDDKLLTVTIGNTEPPGAKLVDILPPAARAQIQANGPWSLSTAVLRLDGNLLSGHSGAPLVGSDGSVVGIGAGGLERGAGGVVWAVRASYLLQPTGWTQASQLAGLNRPSGLAFADQAPQQQVPTVACGAFKLSRSRSITLAVLARDADDPSGLQKILAAVGGSLSAGNNTKFDVWVDQDSGASIPVPAGTQIMSGPVGCMAIIDQLVGLNIVTFAAPAGDTPQGRQQVNDFSVMFERTFYLPFPNGLNPDPAFTYMMPINRPDGFQVNRKAFGRLDPAGPNRVAMNYVFITHMARGKTYAGVSAMRQTVVPQDQLQACIAANTGAACAAIRPLMEIWAKAAIAVQMATIPPI